MNDILIDDLPEIDVRVFFDLDHPLRRGLRETDWKDFSSKEELIKHEIYIKENELKLLEGNFTPRKENRQGVSLKTYQKNKDSLLKIGLEKEFLSHQFIDEFIKYFQFLSNNERINEIDFSFWVFDQGIDLENTLNRFVMSTKEGDIQIRGIPEKLFIRKELIFYSTKLNGYLLLRNINFCRGLSVINVVNKSFGLLIENVFVCDSFLVESSEFSTLELTRESFLRRFFLSKSIFSSITIINSEVYESSGFVNLKIHTSFEIKGSKLSKFSYFNNISIGRSSELDKEQPFFDIILTNFDELTIIGLDLNCKVRFIICQFSAYTKFDLKQNETYLNFFNCTFYKFRIEEISIKELQMINCYFFEQFSVDCKLLGEINIQEPVPRLGSQSIKCDENNKGLICFTFSQSHTDNVRIRIHNPLPFNELSLKIPVFSFSNILSYSRELIFVDLKGFKDQGELIHFNKCRFAEQSVELTNMHRSNLSYVETNPSAFKFVNVIWDKYSLTERRFMFLEVSKDPSDEKPKDDKDYNKLKEKYAYLKKQALDQGDHQLASDFNFWFLYYSRKLIKDPVTWLVNRIYGVTCGYGLSVLRPLSCMVLLFFVFAFFYKRIGLPNKTAQLLSFQSSTFGLNPYELIKDKHEICHDFPVLLILLLYFVQKIFQVFFLVEAGLAIRNKVKK